MTSTMAMASAMASTMASTLTEPNLVEQIGEWTEDVAVQEFPTNAFGEISFINEDEGSIKPAK